MGKQEKLIESLIPEWINKETKADITKTVLEAVETTYKKYSDHLEQQIESMKCCGNCVDELNQEESSLCEYCVRYENNFDEGGEYQDKWQSKVSL